MKFSYKISGKGEELGMFVVVAFVYSCNCEYVMKPCFPESGLTAACQLVVMN